MRQVSVQVSFVAALVVCAGSVWATGPTEQNSTINGIPRLLSHVQVHNSANLGSGTIIDKKTDVNGDAWVCVLTADHVLRGGINHQIDIGSGTLTTYGGASSIYLSASANVVGKDLAVLAVKLGNVSNAGIAATYNALAPVRLGYYGPDYNAANPRAITHTIFTEHGYGDTGSFVNGGMSGGINSQDVRRFQDNQVERWRHVVEAGRYDYYAVEWDFNIPAANGPLLTEGLSYIGDSGGAYCTTQLETKTVLNAFRQNIKPNADGTGTNIPDVPANSQLGLWVNDLIAVHTSGSSNGRTFNPFTTYDNNGNPIAQNVGGKNDYSWGAGVPMTADTLTWVQEACNAVPAPSVTAIGLMSGLFAVRRRRR